MIEEPVKQKEYIDITDLSNFLRSDWMKRFNLDGDYMQLIEEVVFLCVNESFINDIQSIRQMILKKYPKLNIPASNQYQAEAIVDFIYKNLHEDYKKSAKKIVEKYKLLPELYWEDMFFVFDGKIKEEIRKENAFNATNNMNLKLLDSIVVRNKPFDENDAFPFWANPYFTRKTDELGGITINLKNNGLPFLQIGFPPYATIQEMQKLIKENYQQIQEYREKHLPLPIQRDHRKDNLPKMIDAYMLNVKGERKAVIANFLDKRYGGNISFEAINQLVNRIKTESNRFNQNKQET
jgi:hypothetical protein